jgi:hypothetical protein
MAGALIVAGAAFWILTAFWLRTRSPKIVVTAVAVVSGALVGAGALMLQSEVTPLEWAVTLPVLGAMLAFQARLIEGPFGKPAPVSGTVAPRR